jgi:hypothetical protein
VLTIAKTKTEDGKNTSSPGSTDGAATLVASLRHLKVAAKTIKCRFRPLGQTNFLSVARNGRFESLLNQVVQFNSKQIKSIQINSKLREN